MFARIELPAVRRENDNGTLLSAYSPDTDLFINLRDWKVLVYLNDKDGAEKPKIVFVPRKDEG
jgi:hypothetical protein